MWHIYDDSGLFEFKPNSVEKLMPQGIRLISTFEPNISRIGGDAVQAIYQHLSTNITKVAANAFTSMCASLVNTLK